MTECGGLSDDLTPQGDDPQAGENGRDEKDDETGGEAAGRPPGRRTKHGEIGGTTLAQDDTIGLGTVFAGASRGFDHGDAGRADAGSGGEIIRHGGGLDPQAFGSLAQKQDGATFAAVELDEVGFDGDKVVVVEPLEEVVEFDCQRRRIIALGAARDDRGIGEARAEAIHLGKTHDDDAIPDLRTAFGLDESHGDARCFAAEEDLPLPEGREDGAAKADAMAHRSTDGEGEDLAGRNVVDLFDRPRGSDDGEITPIAAAQVGLDELAAVIHLPGSEPGDADAGIDEIPSSLGDGFDLHRDDPRTEIEADEGGVFLIRGDRPDNALHADALVVVAAREQIIEGRGNRRR